MPKIFLKKPTTYRHIGPWVMLPECFGLHKSAAVTVVLLGCDQSGPRSHGLRCGRG